MQSIIFSTNLFDRFLFAQSPYYGFLGWELLYRAINNSGIITICLRLFLLIENVDTRSKIRCWIIFVIFIYGTTYR